MVLVVDSHCHLDYEGLSERLPQALEAAEAAGVGLMVSISTRVRTFERVLRIAEENSNVYCTIGTHPHNAHEELDVTVTELVEIAGHPKVVGIGEAGLDYHYDYSPRQAQAQGFRLHVAAARETGLPLVIHSRKAEADTATILEEEMRQGAFKPLLHCFTSSLELARRGLALGAYVSFSGILTYKNAGDLRSVAADVPMDRLLVETDAPYLAPPPHRGRPNRPAWVPLVGAGVAAAKGIAVEDVEQASTTTAAALFRLA